MNELNRMLKEQGKKLHQASSTASELTQVIYGYQLHCNKCPSCKYGDGAGCVKADSMKAEIVRLKAALKHYKAA